MYFDYFCMQSTCNPLVEDFDQVFCMINEGGVPPSHCEMNLRWSKSIRYVDDLSFILIYFNLPALALRLNCIETTLQLSGEHTFFAIHGIQTSVFGKDGLTHTWFRGGGGSFIYKLYNSEDTTKPQNSCLDRKELTSLIKFVDNLNFCSLYNKPGCHVVSKTFSI
jgi:hypothetical protein